MNYMKKITVGCSLGLLLLGYSSGSPTSGGDAQSAVKKIKAVRISNLGIIPTNHSIGKHYIKVNNNTGEILNLDNFVTTDNIRRNLISRWIDKTNRLFSGHGYDSRIDLQSCSKLQSGGSCVIAFTPDKKDGSLGLQLNYTSQSGKPYKAAQLLEFTSSANKINGFVVANTSTQQISSDSDYSISIPFIVDEHYKSLTIDSQIKPLSSNFDCSNGAVTGQHCTAIVTMPAGNYSNIITISGIASGGKVKSFEVATLSTLKNLASLNVTSAPLLIDAGSGTATGVVTIVNNGVVDSETNSESLSNIESISDSLANIGSLLGHNITKSYKCAGVKVSNLPAIIAPGDMCEITFVDDGMDIGADLYKLSYGWH